MTEFARPHEGQRFALGGLKLNAVPDAVAPPKLVLASNVRGTLDGSTRTRPGQALKFSTAALPVTDLAAYAAIQTDDLPRYLARLTNDAVYLDNGSLLATLSGGGASPGVTTAAFRPAQSPQSWLYMANGTDYQKFSAPTPAVTVRKAGIAEPQSAPDACPDQYNVFEFTGVAVNWANAGTAGALTDQNRVTDTSGVVSWDLASSLNGVTPLGMSTRFSIQVATASQYQVGMTIVLNDALGVNIPMVVQDIIPPAAPNSSITIQAIQYLSGATGACVIVPSQMPVDNSVPEFEGLNPVGESISNQARLAGFRRGALLTLGGTETVFVRTVTHGPQGQVSIEVVTGITHAVGETLVGLPTLIASSTDSVGNLGGRPITAAAIQSAVGAGTGTISKAIAAANNPFTHQPFVSNPLLPTAQQDDYVHLSVRVSDVTLLTNIRLLFDVGDGSFTQNYFYYDIQPDALSAAVAGTQSQLGAAMTAQQQSDARSVLSDAGGDVLPTVNPSGARLPGLIAPDIGGVGANINPSGTATLGASQWTEIMFPIRAFTRVGNDQSKTLANTNAVRVQVVATGAGITFQFGSIWVGSGSQPDVGDIGVLYFYRVRPRDSRTGVRGNPSPSTRYGVSPRRQQVVVPLPSAAYDAQIDTWDIFRYGGTVTSWRYIGSATASATIFIDNVFDVEAQAGEPLDFDNFEPWPSIDNAQALTSTSITGTLMLVSIPAPTNVLRWLPGTLVQVAGGQVYTLRIRPVLTSGTTYRLEFVECLPTAAAVAVSIMEPVLGNQPQPYIWGPDATGVVFGVGDPLRPSVVSYAKGYAPDTVRDADNLELCAPSEPLLGGEILDGLSFVASSSRWWALYPQPDNPTQRYNQVQQPVPRGLAAPFGHCNNGAEIFFWAADGIWSHARGTLTEGDLYNLFPHDGVPGQAVTYHGVTYQPPDYSRAGTFRLAYVNGYLYATYQDASATYHTLVLSTRSGAWTMDDYTPAVSAILHPQTQAGTVLSSTARYDQLLTGNIAGQVATETRDANDLGGPITCHLAPGEYDGGDVRAPKQWGDFFLDLTPSAAGGVTVTPLSGGSAVAAATVVSTSSSRQRAPVSVGGIVVSDFLGLHLTWVDDFTLQSSATEVNLWQPSYDIQPARLAAFFTFGTSFAMRGFGHIGQLALAWVSTAPITLTITATDGQSPAPITLPSSGGAYTKQVIRPTANKGQLYRFSASSAAQFQLFLMDSEMWVGMWNRQGPYEIVRGFGGKVEEEAVV